MDGLKLKVQHRCRAQFAAKDAKDKIVVTPRPIDQRIGMVKHAGRIGVNRTEDADTGADGGILVDTVIAQGDRRGGIIGISALDNHILRKGDALRVAHLDADSVARLAASHQGLGQQQVDQPQVGAFNGKKGVVIVGASVNIGQCKDKIAVVGAGAAIGIDEDYIAGEIGVARHEQPDDTVHRGAFTQGRRPAGAKERTAQENFGRCVVDAANGHRYVRLARLGKIAIVDDVEERIATKEVGLGGILNLVANNRHRAIARRPCGKEGQWVAVRFRVIGQYVDENRRIFGGRRAVRLRLRHLGQGCGMRHRQRQTKPAEQQKQ